MMRRRRRRVRRRIPMPMRTLALLIIYGVTSLALAAWILWY
jgi:hypothetical protein